MLANESSVYLCAVVHATHTKYCLLIDAIQSIHKYPVSTGNTRHVKEEYKSRHLVDKIMLDTKDK